jgi:hypothetical protein
VTVFYTGRSTPQHREDTRLNRTEAEQALTGSGLSGLTARHLADVAAVMGCATGPNSARITYTVTRGWHVETMNDINAVSP